MELSNSQAPAPQVTLSPSVTPLHSMPQSSSAFYDPASEISGLNACLCTSLEALKQMATGDGAPLTGREIENWTRAGVKEYNRTVRMIVQSAATFFLSPSRSDIDIETEYQFFLCYTQSPLLDPTDVNAAYQSDIIGLPETHLKPEDIEVLDDITFFRSLLEILAGGINAKTSVLCLIGSSYFAVHFVKETGFFSIYDPHGPVGEKVCDQEVSTYATGLTIENAAHLLAKMYPDSNQISYFIVDPVRYSAIEKRPFVTEEKLQAIFMSLLVEPPRNRRRNLIEMLSNDSNPLFEHRECFLTAVAKVNETTVDFEEELFLSFTFLYNDIIPSLFPHIRMPEAVQILLAPAIIKRPFIETFLLQIAFFDLFPLIYENRWTKEALIEALSQKLRSAIDYDPDDSYTLVEAYEYFFRRLEEIDPTFAFSDILDHRTIHLDGKERYQLIACTIMEREFLSEKEPLSALPKALPSVTNPALDKPQGIPKVRTASPSLPAAVKQNQVPPLGFIDDITSISRLFSFILKGLK